MLVLLLIIQLFCVVTFCFLVLVKNKVSYFGLSILLLQFLTLTTVFFFRIKSNGISSLFFLYILVISAALPNVLQFFSNNQETKLKTFFNEVNTRLDQNFFNLTLFNQISFYLSRKIFKKIFLVIQKKLYNFDQFFILLFLPYSFLVGTVVFDVFFYNKIYFSPIFLSFFFFCYRFILLILRINEYYSKEGLHYLTITFRKMNFYEPIPHFQKISNFLDLSPQDLKNPSFLIEKWYIYFAGITYSSSYILSNYLRSIVLPFFFNFLMWILFFFSSALISFNSWQTYPALLILSFLIVTIPLTSFIYVLIGAFKTIPEIYDLKLFQLEVSKQKALFETLSVFKLNFSHLELTQNLIIPKNRPPINLVECFNRNLRLVDPIYKKTFRKEFCFFIVLFLFSIILVNDNESFSMFFHDLSFLNLFSRLLILIFLIF